MSFVKILYNGKDAFFPQPVPFVSVDYQNIYYGEQWAKEEVLTLNGNVTGCTFAAIVAAQSGILDNFRSSFQTLQIWEQDGVAPSGLIFQKDLVYVDAINFTESRWIGVLPYTIKLRCYPSGYFSGAFGILNPSDTWSFQEEQDRSVAATHAISCRALNTSTGASNSLTNAISWVTQQRGLASIISPLFIPNVYSGNFCLSTTVENVDRINGTYGVTDTYRTDPTRSGYGILRYQGSVASGDGVISVHLEGSIQGCNTDIDSARAVFQSFNFTGAALKIYNEAVYMTGLNPVPVSNSIEELPYDARINFSYDFDNSNLPPVYFDYTVSMSSGDSIGVGVDGEIVARGGDTRSKLTTKLAFLSGLDLYETAIPFYNDFYPYSAIAPLNPRPLSSGININPIQGTVTVHADFSNQEQVSVLLDSFDYTLSFQPSVNKIDFKQTLNGQGNVSMVNLNYVNRAALSVKGTARINPSAAISAGLAAIRAQGQSLFNTYGRPTNATLDQKSVNADRTDQRLVSFDFAWSFESPNTASVAPFTSVNTLAV